MTIGALQSSFKARDGEENPDFIRLRESRDNLQAVLGIADLKLSMGMSNDFAEALRSGSDSVRYVEASLNRQHRVSISTISSPHFCRVGSRIFGERPSKEEAKEQRKAQTSS